MATCVRYNVGFYLIRFNVNCKEGAVKLPYGDRNQMFALKRQALKGPFTSDKMPALGWFDWVGHDIKYEWG